MAQLRVGVVTYGRADGKGIRLAAYRAAESLQELSPHALAAYRAGARIEHARTGAVHDFTKRRGVGETFIVLPAEAPACYSQREVLWSFADQAEGVRKNARVAREVLISLPHELSAEGRSRAVHAIAEHLVERYRMAVDAAIHHPPTTGDERHHHAHLLCSTRRLGPKGFELKTRELDHKKTGRLEVEHIRAKVAEFINAEMAREAIPERVEHKSGRRQLAEHRAKQKQKEAARPNVSALYIQAHATWRKLDQRRRFAEDPEAQDRVTKLEVADRDRVLRQTVIADRVALVEAKIGRKTSTRERREITRLVDQQRRNMARRGKWVSITDTKRRHLVAQRQVRDVQSRMLEPQPGDSAEVLANKLERMQQMHQQLIAKKQPETLVDKLAAMTAKLAGRESTTSGRSM